MLAQLYQPFDPIALLGILTHRSDARIDIQELADSGDECPVDFTEPRCLGLGVEAVDGFFVELKSSGGRVVVAKRMKMPVDPPGVVDPGLSNRLMPAEAIVDGDGQPSESVGRLDPISVAPVILCVLDVVVQDELVGPIDEIKVPLPWNVVRLDHGKCSLPSSLPRVSGGSVMRGQTP